TIDGDEVVSHGSEPKVTENKKEKEEKVVAKKVKPKKDKVLPKTGGESNDSGLIGVLMTTLGVGALLTYRRKEKTE
ncbi:LPXTG cell wall anchor domain-containing protein, partial [Staphylococcus agnetis]